MGLLDSRREQVRKVPLQARTALVAAAAGRVVPVYEKSWFGDHYPEVGRSVEVGWAFALGEPVDATEHARLLAVIQDQVDFYYEDDTRDGLLAKTVTVVLRLLQSMTPDEEESVLATARGTLTAVDAAGSAEAQANIRSLPAKGRRAAVDEEQVWQDAAVTLVGSWFGPVRRDMFVRLGGHPPNWFTDWLARSER